MVQNRLQYHIQKMKNFYGFAKFFVKKNVTIDNIFGPFLNGIKDYFSLLKRKKMAKYRVDYQRYKLRQMEELIAQNNSHHFLSGRRVDDLR